MKTLRLEEMTRGWFVGDFAPTVIRTDAVEVAVKRYRAGEREPAHHHRIAAEITVVVQGTVLMNGREYGPGDIILMEPNEKTDFHALTDATTTVVKIPGARDDKYLDEPGVPC